MRKIIITELEEEKRNELIKKNKKLIDRLQSDLYEYEMFIQQEEGELMLGKDKYKYININDHYSSFYLTLKDWHKFIENVNNEYFSSDEQTKLYNEIIKEQKELDNIEDPYSDEFNDLENEIEEKCKKLLKLCEDQLHVYEEYPTEDDAIQYADEMEQLEEYYIEEREDGTTDGVIRKDISFTECYI